MRFIASFSFFLLFLLNASGCGSLPKGINATTNDPFKLNEDEVLVYGKISYKYSGKDNEKYSWFFGKPILQMIRNPDLGKDAFRNLIRTNRTVIEPDNETYLATMSTDRDGGFYYKIPAGKYLLHTITIVNHRPAIYPALLFDAPVKGKAYYLGTVIVDVEGEFSLGGFLFSDATKIYTNLNSIDVIDEYQQQSSTMLEKVEGAGQVETHKSLLQKIPDQHPIFIGQGVVSEVKFFK